MLRLTSYSLPIRLGTPLKNGVLYSGERPDTRVGAQMLTIYTALNSSIDVLLLMTSSNQHQWCPTYTYLFVSAGEILRMAVNSNEVRLLGRFFYSTSAANVANSLRSPWLKVTWADISASLNRSIT